MIIDKLENAKLYYSLSENIKKGLDFLEKTDLVSQKNGKHVIDGENIYANVQTGLTKDEETTPWEIHKVYTDIQYVIKGAEIMGWANADNFSVTKEYDKEKDIAFGEAKNSSFVTVPAGYFVIFTPQDAHKPMLKIGENKEVKKVIVKVKA